MICPVCSSKKLVKKDLYNEYTLYKCSSCDVEFWTPLKQGDKNFYEGSDLHRIEGIKPLQWRHVQFFKKMPLKSGNLLDVACGTGEFLNEARKKGFKVWGIDLSSRQIDAARKFYKLDKLFNEPIEKFVLRNDVPKFDVITFFEVLEHLDDPHIFIDNLKKVLSPDGFIVFSVPNANRVAVGKEVEEVPPNHLFRWNKSSISKFIDLKGFSIKTIREQLFSKDFFLLPEFLVWG